MVLSFKFQQDDNPAHTAHAMQDWLHATIRWITIQTTRQHDIRQ